MNRCTECKFPLEEGMLICPQCGADISLQSDVESRDENPGITDTIDLAGGSSPEAFGIPDANEDESLDSDGRHETIDVGSGTVSAPGIEAETRSEFDTFEAFSNQDEEAEDDELSQTIDAGTELDEADDFEFDDFFPGVQSDVFPLPGQGKTVSATEGVIEDDDAGESSDSHESTDNQATPNQEFAGHGDYQATLNLDAEGNLDSEERLNTDNQATIDAFQTSDQGVGAIDPHATHISDDHVDEANKAGQLTIDMASEDRPTHHSTDGHVTIAASQDKRPRDVPAPEGGESGSDDAGTVVLPGGFSENSGERTVVYESASNENSTIEASGTSGTEGRLKALWAGVAGSSENPMHSLQAGGLQASDTVFQRVATRRVADASTAEDSLADYQIVDKLGEGAMGIVFSARQTAVNRIVALKTAKPNFQANEESRRRFLYEAHITADLDHSNIVPIHELGASEDGKLFYSMKLVQGTEWSRVMRKKTREQNLEIFMKVTDAMAFAHSKGVIHRDLKPENTMLGRFGEVFVTDWGTAINLDKDTTLLAKPAAKGDRFLTVEDGSNFVRGDSLVLHDGIEAFDRIQIVSIDEANKNRIYLRKKLTHDYEPSTSLRVMKAMNLAGTPCYMAPEMAGHQLPKIGKTSDIYILGAILYDLVTGRPPHTGNSVTQCLRAALKNEAVDAAQDHEDALMVIALKAMATNPHERYQTVEELQDAVREYRRHAESIALSERSDELLEKAIEQKDYQSFSRTLFGYRDAIELWPENKSAISGLRRARLALGEVAYKNGDNDLVLQTLDRDVPEERTLYEQAVAAKKKSDGREASLRLLKKVMAAVVLFAIAGLSGLAYLANQQKNIAQANEKKANESAQQESIAKIAAENAQREAEGAREKEEIEKRKALDAQKLAEEAKIKEEIEKGKALTAQADAERQKVIATDNERIAQNEKRIAEAAKAQAVEAANEAKRRSAQIQLGEYNSSLALAKSQIESFDVAASNGNLARLDSMFKATGDEDVFFGNGPKIDTWGWKRIQLLGNVDLPRAQIGGQGAEFETQVSVSAYAPQANMAVIGTRTGLVQVLVHENQQLKAAYSLNEPGAVIVALAISPDGKEVVYGTTRGDVSDVKRWDVATETAQEVVATKNRLFQHFTYSTDGQQLLAGISGGIWIWDRSNDWYSREEPTQRVNSIRGELTNLQGIEPQRTLLTTLFKGEVLLGVLDHAAGSIQLVEGTESLAAPISSAGHTLIDNQIVLGLSDNRLAVGALDATTARISSLIELEEKHRAPVTNLVSNGRDRLVTSSTSEPVAHVWSYDTGRREWAYDTYLTGTAKNISGVGLLGQDQVFAVDQAGKSIVWDVERQKQRRRLERVHDSQLEEYPSAVQAVVAGPSNGRAIAIDENGVVDLWSLTDGTTSRLDLSRWSYFGHTPGAVLVDSAVDIDRGIIVTAASLQNARKEYLSNPTHAWEFCTWNASSGEMLRRWSADKREVADARIESIEQRISLVDQGRQILFASDSETRLVDLNSGSESFLQKDFGSYFAIPNPRNPALLMLIKRSGSLRLLDLDNLASWNMSGHRNYALADPSDIPLQGIWSEDGQRFYLTFATGGLAQFQWNGSQLELLWSTRSRAEQGQNSSLSQLLGTSSRVKSHLDVDMMLTGTAANEQLHVATRNRGLNAVTKLVTLRFGAAAEPSIVNNATAEGVQWLQVGLDGAPVLSKKIHDVLVVDAARIRSRLRVNNRVFVSTASAQVLEFVDGQGSVTSFGRSKLISTTGSRDGKSLLALHEDGSIWKFTHEAETGLWSRMTYTALGASSISLSPDGTQLLIIEAGQGKLVEPATGRGIAQIGEIRAAAWDRNREARLAVCRSDGELELLENSNSIQLAEKPNYSNSDKVVSVSFFNEAWGNGNPPRQFLLLQSEREGKGYMQFIPIDPAPADATDAKPELTEIRLGSKVTVSPTENIIATGAPSGTVAILFASPTHERQPRQLFDLEGHRGGDITCLEFSSDGRTIITADSKNRLFAWLSTDPLLGK